jgi:DNA-binding winged helix-turn-helix (wHTH) protein
MAPIGHALEARSLAGMNHEPPAAATPSPRPGHIARFGVFDLDPRTGELHKRGLRVHLQEQPFQVLAALIARAGDLVTREELRQRLWSGAVFVDFDLGLNKAVAKIRAALGDSAESPRFVETLERRGYRFIAHVEWVAGGHDAPPHPVPQAPPPAAVVRVTAGDTTTALAEGTHVVGRDPAAAIWIDSAIVSKHHARIVVFAQRVTIEDTGSLNGTFVNDVRLTAPAPLANGDVIRVGSARLVIHLPSGFTATLPARDGE